MIIFKKFSFESAHALPNVPEGHKCKAVHGHSYHMNMMLEGAVDEKMNWVMDFAEVKDIVKSVIKMLDHKYLNDIEGLENPTCEQIAIWIWDKVKPQLPLLKRIELNETATSGVIYDGK